MTEKPKATPRDLDPKFRDAEVPADKVEDKGTETVERYERTETVEDDKAIEDERTDREQLAAAINGEVPNDADGWITHRETYVDSAGKVGEKVHGPMRVSEWSVYSKEHGL